MTTIIRVENVYKRYDLHAQPKRLRHDFLSMFKKSPTPSDAKPFYALNDLSFEVKKGECLGIVGRNGSGKTTLLRLLAGITEASSGKITVTGRFSALIALTAGFNVLRTGRENIYLSAAIQGIAPKTVEPFVQEIIDFSELAAFIDSPVRHYSSGMIARLGFSIAVNLAPDIIFLDEILSVGDSGFQAKSLARIEKFKSEGRTLIIVSHGDLLKTLTERTLWLEHGVLKMDADTSTVLDCYNHSLLK